MQSTIQLCCGKQVPNGFDVVQLLQQCVVMAVFNILALTVHCPSHQ